MLRMSQKQEEDGLQEMDRMFVFFRITGFPTVNSTVSCLIDSVTCQQNRGFIFESSNQYIAYQIISIPLLVRQISDKLLLHWEKDRNYSVRSAHHVLCEGRLSSEAETSSRGNAELWRRIWSAQNFLWRLAKNILPTRMNLSKKGIDLDVCCRLSHSETEDSDHLFMHCLLNQLFGSPLLSAFMFLAIWTFLFGCIFGSPRISWLVNFLV